MDKLFNIEDGQLFGGVRNNLFKAEDSSFAPENVVLEESSENMQLIKAAFANAQAGRSFTYLGRVYTVEAGKNRSIICEPIAKANVPLVDFVDEASFASALLLIKASIERYPKDDTSDALAKARQEASSMLAGQKLNDSFEDDSLDKAVVEKNNELIEKAKKGSPEYEEWLRKYREKRGKKMEEPSEGRKKSAKEDTESGQSKSQEEISKLRNKAKDVLMNDKSNSEANQGTSTKQPESSKLSKQFGLDESITSKEDSSLVGPSKEPISKGEKERRARGIYSFLSKEDYVSKRGADYSEQAEEKEIRELKDRTKQLVLKSSEITAPARPDRRAESLGYKIPEGHVEFWCFTSDRLDKGNGIPQEVINEVRSYIPVSETHEKASISPAALDSLSKISLPDKGKIKKVETVVSGRKAVLTLEGSSFSDRVYFTLSFDPSSDKQAGFVSEENRKFDNTISFGSILSKEQLKDEIIANLDKSFISEVSKQDTDGAIKQAYDKVIGEVPSKVDAIKSSYEKSRKETIAPKVAAHVYNDKDKFLVVLSSTNRNEFSTDLGTKPKVKDLQDNFGIPAKESREIISKISKDIKNLSIEQSGGETGDYYGDYVRLSVSEKPDEKDESSEYQGNIKLSNGAYLNYSLEVW